MTATVPTTIAYDPAFLLAVLVSARRSRDETLVALAETALADQGISVTFDSTTTEQADATTATAKPKKRKAVPA